MMKINDTLEGDVMESVMIRLHDLLNETERVMRFIDQPFALKDLSGKVHYIHGLLIRHEVVESEYDPDDTYIDDIRRIKSMKLFGETSSWSQALRKSTKKVTGKAVILARKIGFIEADVHGYRRRLELDRDSLDIILKDPVSRDVVYIVKTYGTEIHNDILLKIKAHIEINILDKPKKRQILTRLIDFVNEFERTRNELPDGDFIAKQLI